MAEGLTVHPRPTAIPDDWIAAYGQFRTALLGHVTDDGFVDERIRLLAGAPARPVQVVGTAITVRLPDGDLEALTPAVDLLQPGDVLVIDHGGRESLACWGELTSLAARMRGCAGVVIDGAVTNVAEIAEHGLPTFARAVAARGGRTLAQGGSVNGPIQCGGVAVHPGDLVVADDDGVMVLPPRLMVEVAALAAPIARRAPLARAWLERGGLLGEITGLDAEGVQALLTARGWS